MPEHTSSVVGWEPTASRQMLEKRARVFSEIRAFFAAQDVLEVDVPSLVRSPVTDIHIDSFAVCSASGKQQPPRFYLSSSPEFYMKRLLAAGTGPIFSFSRAYRDEPAARLHQPEFTLLEWYRPGFDEHELMDEVEALMLALKPDWAIERITYASLYQDTLGFDPHSVSLDELRACCRKYVDIHDDADWCIDDYLELLMTHLFEPQMQGLVFVHDYPASQAALARLEKDGEGREVARRFELYCDGIELANGYFELIDASEQRQRFLQDIESRRRLGRPACELDEALLAALEQGLPSSAGVAMGMDRLLMVLGGSKDIAEVMAFTP